MLDLLPQQREALAWTLDGDGRQLAWVGSIRSGKILRRHAGNANARRDVTAARQSSWPESQWAQSSGIMLPVPGAVHTRAGHTLQALADEIAV